LKEDSLEKVHASGRNSEGVTFGYAFPSSIRLRKRGKGGGPRTTKEEQGGQHQLKARAGLIITGGKDAAGEKGTESVALKIKRVDRQQEDLASGCRLGWTNKRRVFGEIRDIGQKTAKRNWKFAYDWSQIHRNTEKKQKISNVGGARGRNALESSSLTVASGGGRR